MASKINTTYWGSNVDPATYGQYTLKYGLSSNTLRALIQGGKYDPNTDSFDLSVSPWGIGASSAGNRGILVVERSGSRDGSVPGKITKIAIEGIDRENYNRPFALVSRAAGGFLDNYNYFSMRVGGDITVNENNYICNHSGYILTSNSTSDNCISNIRVATYLDYQSFRLGIYGFTYLDLDTGSKSYFQFYNSNETPAEAKTRFDNSSFPEHFAICNINISPNGYAMYSGTPTQWDSYTDVGYQNALMMMRGHAIGDTFRLQRLSDSVDDTSKFKVNASWNIGAYGVRSGFDDCVVNVPDSNHISSPYVKGIPVSETDYRSGTPSYSTVLLGIGVGYDNDYSSTTVSNYYDGEQQFSDVSYKQRAFAFTVDNSVLTEVTSGFSLSSSSSQFKMTSIYDIRSGSGSAQQQILALLKHETAFYGFEFFVAWGKANGGTWSVGDADLYLPVFDSHLITTGNYVSGSAALTAQNASWGNVFGDDMPTYDSEYNPEISPELDERDRGDLENRTPTRLSTSGTVKYVCDFFDINALQNYLNGSYSPSEVQWIEDFKGTNPADYIVSIQKYPFSLPSTGTAEIVIGSVGTNINAKFLFSSLYAINSSSIYDFGEIDLTGALLYNDFRDYLCKLTLILPFIGSIDLDPRMYMRHSLGLRYIIDYDTGSVAAEIKRDGLTMETKTSTISITIPFFAANMGQYQNALAQTQFAIEQSKIKQIAGIMSTSISIGGTLATGASGGALSDTASLGAAGGLVGGIASMLSGQVQQQQLQYELEHTAPQIGSVSVAAPANAFFLDDRARLIITRPCMIPGYNAEVYSHTVGNACAIPGTLSSFSGYTIASAAELSSITARDGSGVSPTAEELRMIKQALQAGIYV